MSGYQDRFRHFSHEEMSFWVAELEAQTSRRGMRMLTTQEIESLLGLLPASFFRLLKRLRLYQTARGAAEFEESLSDFGGAVENLVRECRERLASGDEDAAGEWLVQMDRLQAIHPALWYRVYLRLKEESLSLALELEPEDKEEPFRKP